MQCCCQGRQLQAEINRFKQEAQNFQAQAQANGQAWAQQKGAELQKREQQLSYAQQGMLQQLQQESGVEMDSLVKGIKSFIKDYGKEKGYSYIYGTGEAVSILYAEDKYDMIFSDYEKADFRLDWYDPDTSYEEDVFYFKMALDEWMDKQEIIAKQIDLDFE